ncbi:amino acid transporter [Pseudoroseomonas deserti]|uniref:Amino acid transporter n=1 Tax=Teichococcus deserti TaxID=1817963 RepID=A0A1V2GYY9_9PROT|nr:LysE family transporter [Pseudoroseomonas deserti]ONG50449.1 amino acid transporter [Pseudoroseomonas deserti]
MTTLPASAFLGGFALTFSLIVSLGAQNLFLLRQGLRREHVGAVVAFCILADILLMAAGVAGIGRLLQAVPGLAAWLTLGGAAFLAWYGYGAAQRAWRGGAGAAAARAAGTPLAATLLQAAAITLLNPHVYLDTVLLVGVAGSALAAEARPLFLAGAGSASLIWFAGLGYGARLLAPLFARPGAWRVLDGAVAAVMLLLAIGLLASLRGSLGIGQQP